MHQLEFEAMRTASDIYISHQNINPITHLNKTSNYLTMKLDKELMSNLEQKDPTFKNRLESMISKTELGTKIHLDPRIVKQTPENLFDVKWFDFREWMSLFCKENGYDLNVTTDFIALERHIKQNKKIFVFLSKHKVPVGCDKFYSIIYNLVCNDT